MTTATMTTTIVRTRQGRLRGSLAGGVHTFQGVPYAAPPFGADRLRPPRPVEPLGWRPRRPGLRAGAATAAAAGRPPGGGAGLGSRRSRARTASTSTSGRRTRPRSGLPVMVWIPGGMFEVGTGASYDGSRFARDGVVCVTINYRVGPEGFLYLARRRSRTSACSTRSPHSSGCARTSPRSAAIPPTSRSSASRPAR